MTASRRLPSLNNHPRLSREAIDRVVGTKKIIAASQFDEPLSTVTQLVSPPLREVIDHDDDDDGATVVGGGWCRLDEVEKQVARVFVKHDTDGSGKRNVT